MLNEIEFKLILFYSRNYAPTKTTQNVIFQHLNIILDADDANIYYNDVEVFGRHCVAGAPQDDTNIYHVVERPATCDQSCDLERSEDNVEYETCENIQR